MLKNIYDKTLKLAAHKSANFYLSVVSFIESSFFPIPPDILLIALALGARKKAIRYGVLCSLGSIVGAMFGFGIGYFLWWSNPGEFSGLAQFFFNIIPGFTQDLFYRIQEQYNAWNFWVIFTAGFTPIPFKIFTVSAGAFNINFSLFLIASTISRSARFLLVTGLIWKFGEPIRNFIDQYFNKLAILFTALLIGGFFIIRYII